MLLANLILEKKNLFIFQYALYSFKTRRSKGKNEWQNKTVSVPLINIMLFLLFDNFLWILFVFLPIFFFLFFLGYFPRAANIFD